MGKTLNHLQEDEYFSLMTALEGKQRHNQKSMRVTYII